MDAPCRTLALPDDDATRRLGARLAELLVPGDVVLLSGDLGAGKTTLVRGLAEALGVDASAVTSPTFALLQWHPTSASGLDGAALLHADLYRIDSDDALQALGVLDDLGAEDVVACIEWPERLRPWLANFAIYEVALRKSGEGRQATLTGPRVSELADG